MADSINLTPGSGKWHHAVARELRARAEVKPELKESLLELARFHDLIGDYRAKMEKQCPPPVEKEERARGKLKEIEEPEEEYPHEET